MSRIDECEVMTLPRIAARQGSITSVEGGTTIPFRIARAYYLYDVPGGESRGGHAHRSLSQLLVCVMGAFDVTLDDGRKRTTVHLDRAYKGLLITPMIWRELDNFSSGGICLVLASEVYDERDYIRTYPQFAQEAAGEPK
jgi:dTDP-4-dehydrorhamnose 3,5-epimerase-like enzyme